MSKSLLLFASIFISLIALCLAESTCEGVNILYPKTDAIIERSENQTTTYLILGNSLNESNTRLKRVTLICDDKQGDRITREVWSGDDALLKVSAIQQDLGKIEQDLPATFWFRISVEQNDEKCEFDSGKFKIAS